MTRAAAEDPGPTAPLDLSDCEREPIHIPGAVQPHGMLMALREPDLAIVQVSDNAEAFCGVAPAGLLGRTLDALVDSAQAEALRRVLRGEAEPGREADAAGPDTNPNADASAGVGRQPLYLSTLTLGPDRNARRPFNALFHRSDGLLLLDLEPATNPGAVFFQNLHPLVRTSIGRLQAARDLAGLCRLAAAEVRRVTGFDRVMIYRFDAEWNGEVVAEDKAADLPPFLGLHYPASDIPAQARELYRANRVRLIADVGYRPSAVVPADNPLTNRPLDLGHSTLRSVSPVHIEYLKNMGVGASMSVSILREEVREAGADEAAGEGRNGSGGDERGGNGNIGPRLWGLIACHHRTPRLVPYEVRTACDFIGQVLSLQLAAGEFNAEAEHRIRLKSILTRLLQHMAAAEHFADGLARHGDELLEYAGAQGAALYFDGHCTLVGRTPTGGQVGDLVRWLAGKAEESGRPGEPEEVYHTDSLAAAYPPAGAFKDVASGLLACSISRVHNTYLLWFRPEVVRTVDWAGEPHRPATADWDGRLHPRKSFELWKQTVRDKSLPWTAAELNAAADLRNAVVGIVLKRAEELAQLSEQLERSNKELEAFSYSVSHDLRAPFRHIVGFADLLQKRAGTTMDDTSRRYVNTIVESARYAGTLVDSLLTFSQMGRAALRRGPVDMNAVVRDVRRELEGESAGRAIDWRVGPLPAIHGDATMVRLVVRNLLSNAVKYTRGRDPAVIEVGTLPDGPAAVPRPAGAARREPQHGGGRQVLLFVRDNGAGFDMQYVDKLFGVFQRLHRAEDFEGTGIGLANVKRIVERHDGRAWAEGRPGEGATFYFTLPAEEARPAARE